MEGSIHDACDHRAGESGVAPRARGVPLDSLETEQEEATPPDSHRVGTRLEFVSDCLILLPIGGAEDDPGAKDEPLRGGAAP